MGSVFSHISESWNVSSAEIAYRESQGTQPHGPFTSPMDLFLANVGYLGVTFFLYRYMQTRERFNCGSFKSILLVYNSICVALAAYVVWGILKVLLNDKIPRKFVCNKLVVPGSEEDVDGHAEFLAHIFWVFYIQKFWEFFDTWFFILRKSFRQVTFLHVFHHSSITLVVGLIWPHDFNADMYLPILLNAFVHVLMYSHYMVSALGMPTPWRPYLTSIQLTQFILIATQSGIAMYRGDGCGVGYFAKFILVIYMASMLILFGNFFLQSYVLKKDSARFGDGVVKQVEPIQITKSHFGRVVLDENGEGKVDLPKSFSDPLELNYSIMPIGKPMPNLHVSHEPGVSDCSFGLAGGSPGQTVSYTVTMITTILGKPQKKRLIPLPPCCTKPNGMEEPCSPKRDSLT